MYVYVHVLLLMTYVCFLHVVAEEQVVTAEGKATDHADSHVTETTTGAKSNKRSKKRQRKRKKTLASQAASGDKQTADDNLSDEGSMECDGS